VIEVGIYVTSDLTDNLQASFDVGPFNISVVAEEEREINLYNTGWQGRR
jgi:hypothetical protein